MRYESYVYTPTEKTVEFEFSNITEKDIELIDKILSSISDLSQK